MRHGRLRCSGTASESVHGSVHLPMRSSHAPRHDEIAPDRAVRSQDRRVGPSWPEAVVTRRLATPRRPSMATPPGGPARRAGSAVGDQRGTLRPPLGVPCRTGRPMAEMGELRDRRPVQLGRQKRRRNVRRPRRSQQRPKPCIGCLSRGAPERTTRRARLDVDGPPQNGTASRIHLRRPPRHRPP